MPSTSSFGTFPLNALFIFGLFFSVVIGTLPHSLPIQRYVLAFPNPFDPRTAKECNPPRGMRADRLLLVCDPDRVLNATEREALNRELNELERATQTVDPPIDYLQPSELPRCGLRMGVALSSRNLIPAKTVVYPGQDETVPMTLYRRWFQQKQHFSNDFCGPWNSVVLLFVANPVSEMGVGTDEMQLEAMPKTELEWLVARQNHGQLSPSVLLHRIVQGVHRTALHHRHMLQVSSGDDPSASSPSFLLVLLFILIGLALVGGIGWALQQLPLPWGRNRTARHQQNEHQPNRPAVEVRDNGTNNNNNNSDDDDDNDGNDERDGGIGGRAQQQHHRNRHEQQQQNGIEMEPMGKYKDQLYPMRKQLSGT